MGSRLGILGLGSSQQKKDRLRPSSRQREKVARLRGGVCVASGMRSVGTADRAFCVRAGSRADSWRLEASESALRPARPAAAVAPHSK
jgi:hypothetical protein